MKNLIYSILALLMTINVYSQNIDSLKMLLPKIKNDSLRALIMLDIASSVYQTDTTAAKTYLLKAQSIGEKINNPFVLSKTYIVLGKLSNETGEWNKALNYFKKGLSVADDAGLKRNKALLLNNLGMLYHKRESYENAFNYYHQFLEISEDIKEDPFLQKAYNNIGTILDEQSRLDLALAYYKKSVSKGKKIHNQKGIAMTYSNIAAIYGRKGQADSSFYYMHKSIQFFKKIKDEKLLYVTYLNLGALYENNKFPDSAKKYYLKTLDYLKRKNRKISLVSPLVLLANLNQTSYHNNLEAEKYYKEAEKYANKQETAKRLVEIYSGLAKLYQDKRNYKLSNEYYKKRINLNDSVYKIERDKKITEIQVKYETEKKEQKIVLQNKENSLQKAIIKQQRTTSLIIILTSISILIVFFGYLVYRSQKYKQKLLKLQVETQDYTKKEISSELHSGIGSELTALVLQLENKLGDTKEVKSIKKIYNHIRTASHILALPDFISSTIEDEIRVLVENFKTTDLSIEADIYSKTKWKNVSPIIQQNIYRIAQELFSNTMKYAQASIITIQLVHHENFIILNYEDNGVGYDSKNIIRSKGYLHEIKDRTQVLNGNFTDDSKIGVGAILTFKFPI